MTGKSLGQPLPSHPSSPRFFQPITQANFGVLGGDYTESEIGEGKSETSCVNEGDAEGIKPPLQCVSDCQLNDWAFASALLNPLVYVVSIVIKCFHPPLTVLHDNTVITLAKPPALLLALQEDRSYSWPTPTTLLIAVPKSSHIRCLAQLIIDFPAIYSVCGIRWTVQQAGQSTKLSRDQPNELSWLDCQ